MNLQTNGEHAIDRIEEDQLYQLCRSQLDEAQWEQAMEAILQLRERYGDTPEVLELLQEVSFRAGLAEGTGEPPALIDLPTEPWNETVPLAAAGEPDHEPAGSIEDDWLYQQSLGLLQQGRWEEAAAGILELGRRYGNTPEIRSLLQEVSLKATLDEEPFAPGQPSAWRRQWDRLGRWGKWVVPAALVMAVGLTFVAVSLRPSPPPPVADEEASRLSELRQQGQFHLASRQYDSAIESFEALLAESPNDTVALEGIASAAEKLQLEALQSRALELLAAKDWEGALRVMDEIEAQDPGYDGLVDERAAAEKQVALLAALEAAETAYAAGDWQQAVLAYEEVQQLDRAYEKTFVADNLFEAYLQRGQELLTESTGSLEPVKEAGDLLAKALAIRPGEPRAVAERDLVQAYLDGCGAYDAGDWLQAVDLLSWVYATRSDYTKAVALLLYDASLRAGQASESQGDVAGALFWYRSALRIAGVDHSQAESRIDALTPDPTPLPVPASGSATIPGSSDPVPSSPSTPSWPYDYSFMGARPHCQRTGVIGVVRDQGGLPVQGVQVKLVSAAGDKWLSKLTDADGGYEIVMANAPLAETWTITLVANEQRLSPSYSFRTSLGCANGLQEYKVDWQRRSE